MASLLRWSLLTSIALGDLAKSAQRPCAANSQRSDCKRPMGAVGDDLVPRRAEIHRHVLWVSDQSTRVHTRPSRPVVRLHGPAPDERGLARRYDDEAFRDLMPPPSVE